MKRLALLTVFFLVTLRLTDDKGPVAICFVAGTRITTPEDARAIEKLRAGDLVFAYDERSKEVVMSTVTRTSVRTVDEVYDLTLRVPGGGRSAITGTGEHPFYVPGSGYVQLKALTVGTQLFTFEGERAEVLAVKARKGAVQVFNFEVEDQHNYYVQGGRDPASAVLVHNTCN